MFPWRKQMPPYLQTVAASLSFERGQGSHANFLGRRVFIGRRNQQHLGSLIDSRGAGLRRGGFSGGRTGQEPCISWSLPGEPFGRAWRRVQRWACPTSRRGNRPYTYPETAPCCGYWLVKLLVRRRRALCPGLSHASWKETTTVACFFVWTLKVVKAWSQCPKSQMPKGARSEAVGLPEPQVTDSPASQSPCLEGEPQGTMASLRHELHQKNPLRHPKEQVIPNVPQEQPEAVGGVKSYRAQLTCPCLPGPNVREKYETFDK
ncbi:uncharacterized protein LOC104652350 isoform X1 [Saimiri boliviensis]|uniref:uncharacterized protein LOC104652350 isoform X1 n=1 Tax=Saimiri boliviensis TaxID=27679 RepID=UPI003D775F14